MSFGKYSTEPAFRFSPFSCFSFSPFVRLVKLRLGVNLFLFRIRFLLFFGVFLLFEFVPEFFGFLGCFTCVRFFVSFEPPRV